jgi:membrane protease YdiL (CAAX protease family)
VTTPTFSRRAAEGTVFIGLWIALGIISRLGANQYLLVGVPLTICFQLLVRKQPIRALWVREAPRFSLDKPGWRWALVLAVIPARVVLMGLIEGNFIFAAWGICAVIGAVASAYAIRKFDRSTIQSLLLCAISAGAVGIVYMAGVASLGHSKAFVSPVTRIETFWGSLFEYFPVSFVLEEVSFRGALDTHLHHPEDPHPWISAILVSALWGIWHFPIYPGVNPFRDVAILIAVHCAIGIPMSFFWRRSGNLAVPAFSHALIDAVRNALITP